MPEGDLKQARELAVGLLSRREHSCRELLGKLKAKGIDTDTAVEAVNSLTAEGLQSDRRFAENYLHSRLQKGYGPVRLAQELNARGVDEDLIASSLDGLAVDWMDVLQSVRQKKFGRQRPAGFSEQARESRFLQYRGFTTDQIRHLYKHKNDDQ